MTFVATWTDDETDAAIRLWKDGVSATIIGCRLGKSRNAVLGKLFRLKLLASRPTKHRLSTRQNRRYTKKTRAPRPQAPRIELRVDPYKPAALPVIPEHERKSLIDLEDNDCRWPCTDGPPHAFCARPKVPGLVYCADHARVAYSPARMPHTPIYAGRLTAHYDLHIVTPREKEDA